MKLAKEEWLRNVWKNWRIKKGMGSSCRIIIRGGIWGMVPRDIYKIMKMPSVRKERLMIGLHLLVKRAMEKQISMQSLGIELFE